MDSSDSSDSYSEKAENQQNLAPKQLAFRNYSKLDPTFEQEYYNKYFSPSYYFVNDPIDKSLDMISNLIDFTPLNQIIKEPPDLITKFKTYILQLIPQQSYSETLNVWPPVFPTKTLQSRPLFKLLLKLIKSSKKPDKILAWFISDVFNKITVVNQDKIPILASAIIISRTKLTTYAVLDDKKYLHIYSQSDPRKRSLASQFREKAVRAIPTDSSTISITGPLGSIINTIQLRKSNLVAPFCAAFTKKPPHLFTFMSDIQNPIPKLMYDAVFAAITHDDGIALRALVMPGVIPAEHKTKVYIALLDIGASANNLTFLLSTFFSCLFEQPSTSIKTLIGPDSILLNLAQAVSLRFKGQFQDTFIKQVADHIAAQKNITFFEHPDKFEQCLFDVLDMTLENADSIPKPIRLICSMLMNFSSLRFNNRDSVWAVVGFFLGSIILVLLDATAVKMGESHKLVREIGKLVRLSFTANEFIPKYARIGNEKLRNEFKPKLYVFLQKVCVVPQNISFGDPPKLHVKMGVEEIIRVIADPNVNAQIVEIIRKITEGEALHTTALSWCVSASLAMQFVSDNETEAPKFPEILSIAPLINPDKHAAGYAALVDPVGPPPVSAANSPKKVEEKGEESSDSEGLKINQEVAKQAKKDVSYEYYSDESGNLENLSSESSDVDVAVVPVKKQEKASPKKSANQEEISNDN